MLAVMSILVFAGAFVLSVGIIAMAVGPQWRRVVGLAMGRVEQSFAPLEKLAMAERRIAGRRRSPTAALSIRSSREAA